MKGIMDTLELKIHSPTRAAMTNWLLINSESIKISHCTRKLEILIHE